MLDANVLLNLYRYPEPARKDLFKVLNKIKERIWVPYHAALIPKMGSGMSIDLLDSAAGTMSRHS